MALPAFAAPTQLYSHGEPTGDEQFMLEVINRARMGPAQEGVFLTTQTESNIVQAYSFFGVNKAQIQAAFAAIPPGQPLAMNKILLGTARAQSLDQQNFQYQGHTSHDGRTYDTRITQGGYPPAAVAENVYAPIGAPISTTLFGHVGFNIDWGAVNADLGHRKAIMGLNDLPTFYYGTLREVGVGLVQNSSNVPEPLSWFITQDFGVTYDTSSGSFGPTTTSFLVGVVYTDLDSDGFYTPGEGAGGITVMPDVGLNYAVTSASGGYAIPLQNLPSGTTSITVTFSGGGLGTRQVVRSIPLNGLKNLKSDVILQADTGTRLVNLSTRLRVETGGNVGIGGFVVAGNVPKKMLVRAVGPSLTADGVSGALSNPTLQIFDSSGSSQPIAQNDDWQTQTGPQSPVPTAADITNTGFPPKDPRESAVLLTLAPGAYTGIVSGVGGEMGTALIEVYDVSLSTTGARAINVATRGHVLTGDAVMIAGFVIQGTHKRRVVIRAIGPSLVTAGVTGVLADPWFLVYSGSTIIAQADNWKSDTARPGTADLQPVGRMADLQSIGRAPGDNHEAALVLTLAPGPYTVIVRGVGDTTGVGLVEVYDAED